MRYSEMDGLTFTILLINAALSFPVVALIIVLVFRQELRQLLSLVRNIKVGSVLEAELTSLQAEQRQFIRQASEQSGGEIEGESDPELIREASERPRSAILKAWLRIEEAVKRAALQKAEGSPVADVSSPIKALSHLSEQKAIRAEDVALFHELRGLRNQVAHLEAFEPSQATALEYVEAASQLEARLKTIAQPKLKPSATPKARY